MKVLLVLPASPSSAPYLQYYLDILKENDVFYRVKTWNKNEDILDEHYLPFNEGFNNMNVLEKIYSYTRFAKSVGTDYRKGNYDILIVFTVQLALLLAPLLLFFSRKYIIDIRDYSPVLKIFFMKKLLSLLCKKAELVCISSFGFKKWLPKNQAYCLSHNVKKDLLYRECTDVTLFTSKNKIVILTIGSLRDLDTNKRLIKDFFNDHDFFLSFVGEGPATLSTLQYKDELRAKNVSVKGKYNKLEEGNITSSSDMINLLLSDDLNSRTLMANRFYLSVIYKKPLIARSGTASAYYVEKYKLGVVVNPDCNIKKQVMSYVESFNEYNYMNGCRKFINNVKCDIKIFEAKIVQIINK